MNIKLMNQFELMEGLPKFRKGCDICNEDKATERFYGACGCFIWICGSCYKKIQNKRDSKKEEGKYWNKFKTLSDDGKAILNAIGVEKEFNLSKFGIDSFQDEEGENIVYTEPHLYYEDTKLKEFIKRIADKSFVIDGFSNEARIVVDIEDIKELAGDKLI